MARRQRVHTLSSAVSQRLPRGQSLNALSPTAEESPPLKQHFDDLEEFDPVASSTPKSYRSRTENRLGKVEFARSNEGLKKMQSREFLRGSASVASASGSARPGPKIHHSKTLTEVESSVKRHPFDDMPHELESVAHFDPPATLCDEPKKKRVVGANSGRELTSRRDSRVQPRASSAGKTPLKYERLPSVQNYIADLPPTPTDDQGHALVQQPISGKREDSMDDRHLMHAVYAPDTLQPIASESEEISPLSGLETFPSFHKSVVENSKSPPEHLPDSAQTSKKQAGKKPHKNMSSDKSSPWSLRHILGRMSPSVGHANKNPKPVTDGAPANKTSPIARWRELVKNSPTPPLATLREKRLFRSTGRKSPHESAESNETVEKKAAPPDWKRKLLNRKLKDQKKPTTLSPDKRLIFEQSPQSSPKKPNWSPTKGNAGSPAKAATNMINRPISQRSSSRPIGGAVKAMAAMFDSASIDSPDGPKPPLTSRSHSDLRSSASFASGHNKMQSPAKSTKSVIAPSPVAPQTPSKKLNDDPHGIGLASSKTYRTSAGHRKQSTTDQSPQDTPSRFPKVALRPTGFVFSASRDEPKMSPSKAPSRDRELSRPPSLGTMIPPREEPPVAHHLNLARPPSAASSLSHLSAQPHPPGEGDNASVNQGYNSPLPTSGSPRMRSGNGLLHAQVRNLQRQLQSKSEEVLHLRRQLETRENMDIGTLSERLREANRDCAMWRDRAEAAERRIAVFEKFAAKARALRSGTSVDNKETQEGRNQDDIGLGNSSKQASQNTPRANLGSEESDVTGHTEDCEVFNNRIRRSLGQQSTRPAEDGAMSKLMDGEAYPMGPDAEIFTESTEYVPLTWRGKEELWAAAEELLDMQDEMDSQPVVGEGSYILGGSG